MRIFLISLLAALLLVPAAKAEDDHVQARRAFESGKIIALSEILNKVEQQFQGRIVNVELIRDKPSEERFIYKVEMLTTSGNLIEVFFDARTGTPIAMGGQGLSDKRDEEK